MTETLPKIYICIDFFVCLTLRPNFQDMDIKQFLKIKPVLYVFIKDRKIH